VSDRATEDRTDRAAEAEDDPEQQRPRRQAPRAGAERAEWEVAQCRSPTSALSVAALSPGRDPARDAGVSANAAEAPPPNAG